MCMWLMYQLLFGFFAEKTLHILSYIATYKRRSFCRLMFVDVFSIVKSSVLQNFVYARAAHTNHELQPNVSLSIMTGRLRFCHYRLKD